MVKKKRPQPNLSKLARILKELHKMCDKRFDPADFYESLSYSRTEDACVAMAAYLRSMKTYVERALVAEEESRRFALCAQCNGRGWVLEAEGDVKLPKTIEVNTSNLPRVQDGTRLCVEIGGERAILTLRECVACR